MTTQTITEKKNIYWIDAVKAICMISVYIMHSASYYGISAGVLNITLTPFYVNAFFFVSGYLFFGKHLPSATNSNPVNGSERNKWAWFSRNIKNVVYRLIIPTIIFSTAVYLPKLIFHSRDLSLGAYVYDILGGTSYWFTSALTVAQIILILLCLTGRKNVLFYFISSVVLFFAAYFLKDIAPSPFPWYYKSGMGATLFMTLGGVYQKYEQKINQTLGLYGYIILCILYVVVPIFGGDASCGLLSMNIDVYGFAISILGIVFIVGAMKLLPSIRFLSYVGKNSIVYYFLSGIVPASLATLFIYIIPNKSYVIMLMISLLSVIIASGMVWLINRYLPFLIDLRNIRFWKKG